MAQMEQENSLPPEKLQPDTNNVDDTNKQEKKNSSDNIDVPKLQINSKQPNQKRLKKQNSNEKKVPKTARPVVTPIVKGAKKEKGKANSKQSDQFLSSTSSLRKSVETNVKNLINIQKKSAVSSKIALPPPENPEQNDSINEQEQEQKDPINEQEQKDSIDEQEDLPEVSPFLTQTDNVVEGEFSRKSSRKSLHSMELNNQTSPKTLSNSKARFTISSEEDLSEIDNDKKIDLILEQEINEQNQSKVDIPEIDEVDQDTLNNESSTEQAPKFSEETKSEWEKFCKTKEIPSFDHYDNVLNYAGFLSYQAIEEQEYDEAEKIEATIKQFKTLCKTDALSSPITSQQEKRKKELDKAIATKESAENDWKNRIEELKQSETARINELEKKHANELKRFEQKCQDPEFLSKFSKPSGHLLQLYQIQKSLAIQHEFYEAKEIKRKVQLLQEQETKEAQRKAVLSIQQNYQKLIRKQEKEMLCAVQLAKRKVKDMEKAMKIDLDRKDKRTKQLKIRVNEAQAKRMNSRDLVIPTTGNASQRSPESNRTAANRIARKKELAPEDAAVLQIQIPEIKKISFRRPSQTSQGKRGTKTSLF